MGFLLDTNVVSEWVKPRPDAGVIRWLAEADEDRVFLSVISLAELRFGIERMPAGARRVRLEEWLRHELPSRFEKRVLSLTADIAQNWGRLMARSQAAGHMMSVMDGFLAATADVYQLTLVTRNNKDFSLLGAAAVLNPWTAWVLGSNRAENRYKNPNNGSRSPSAAAAIPGHLFPLAFSLMEHPKSATATQPAAVMSDINDRDGFVMIETDGRKLNPAN